MTLASLSGREEAEALLALPGPAWILKHSATCPVSSAALEQVEQHLAVHPAPAGLVVVQTHRPLSNWLSERLGFVHQSPQLFLLTAGRVAWHASHWGITAEAMARACGKG